RLRLIAAATKAYSPLVLNLKTGSHSDTTTRDAIQLGAPISQFLTWFFLSRVEVLARPGRSTWVIVTVSPYQSCAALLRVESGRSNSSLSADDQRSHVTE